MTTVDERAKALHYLAEGVTAEKRYVFGKYLFTREPIMGLPIVDVELPPEPSLTTAHWGDFGSPAWRGFRHQFRAIWIHGRRWWGYFVDETMGDAYAAHRASAIWWANWMAVLSATGKATVEQDEPDPEV